MTVPILFIHLLVDRLLDCDFKLFGKNIPSMKFLSFTKDV